MRGPVVGLAIAWALALGFEASAGRTQNPQPTRSVWDGVYSAAQAQRGAVGYERSCAACHRLDLQGNPDAEVPALADDGFLVPWEKSTLADLVNRIARTMPGNRPGSLSRAEYLDIVAHILKVNRFPEGPDELSPDEASLARIVMRKN